ncbi:vanin-like protein 2 isoform X2 [Eurosta solidaginis]|uniref:vanin-like protein 2 isoform X2 n=1 Tax=Eurosta solidaginis TaxID=178769 RepID=UPI0035314926
MAQQSVHIFVKLLFGILLQVAASQSSTINDTHFIAGVVEFRPDVTGLTTAQLIANHTDAYIQILQSAEALDTDIVVFPESSLNNEFKPTYVPAPEDRIIPCLLTSETSKYEYFLIKLSCAARMNRKYVVINLTEQENCTANAAFDPRPCAANALNIYNTNVVFDRRGSVISRYRKVNIYVERRNTTFEPEFAIFDTDFGVRFGHFICFDLNFYTPTEELVVKYGIRNIIFTSMWKSELPFLTGGSRPESGATGSGIYVGDNGALTAAIIGGMGVRQLFVAKVPKFDQGIAVPSPIKRQFANLTSTPQTGISLLRDPKLDNFKSQLLQLNSSSPISMQQCYEKICCTISIETTPSQRIYGNNSGAAPGAYQYRFGVFRALRSYEKEQYSDVAICGIYACTNMSVASCGLLHPANTAVAPGFAFKHLNIMGNFEKATRLLLMPNSLDLNFYSLQPEQVEWKVIDAGKSHSVSIDLKAPADNLLTFGIYANYYDGSGSSNVIGSLMLWLTCLSLWPGICIVRV